MWVYVFYIFFKIRGIYFSNVSRQITFEILVRGLMSIGPGEEMTLLKREFAEFIKGIICVPIKFPGTRLYKSLKVYLITYDFLHFISR